VVDSEEPTRGMAHWYRQADVLLALGNEGLHHIVAAQGA
jgi:hypothetical protein